MKTIVTIVASIALVGIISITAINLSDEKQLHTNALISSEQLRLHDIETKRKQRQTAGTILDFSTSTPVPDTQLRQEGQRAVVPGSLPPKLQALKTELDTLNQEMAEAISTAEPQDTAATDQLILDADTLIAQTNQRLGLDTSEIDQGLMRRIPPTDPVLIELNQKIDTLDAELLDWGKKRLQQQR